MTISIPNIAFFVFCILFLQFIWYNKSICKKVVKLVTFYYADDVKFAVDEHIGHGCMTSQHFHKVYEIYYLTSGEVQYFIEDTIYTLKEGDIVIIPPNTLHKTLNDRNSTRRRLLVYLDADYLKSFGDFDFGFLKKVSVFHDGNTYQIQYIFNALLTEYRGENSELLTKALLCELFVLLDRKKEITAKTTKDSSSSKRLFEVIAYINKNFGNEITLSDISKHFFIHPTYLSRIFKDDTGLSFSDYLRKFRIKKSVELLLNTDKNTTEIAFDVGFNSTNHFCKTFKSIMGLSPLQYRKQHRKE